MEGRVRKDCSSRTGYRGHAQREAGDTIFPSKYFSAEKFLILLCITVSLLILPVILPPLPPPPLGILLLPIGILVLLMFLGLMPSNVTRIASPCE
ncbi:hypothetical protein Cni_G06109 [Canna indica]|uniref:Uncharacterized protein n=1 Tax=Canna indica TaxID=4628 RepID=A0AAQ3JWK4_9LILI|nr:hypothetical protein Cni_G06109 [Canna indica]